MDQFVFRAMSSSVTFVWSRGGEKVQLAGTFNGWKPVEMKPTEDRKRWQLPVQLEGGRHEFKFVVDGQWVHDPDQPSSVNNVGTHNNIVDVSLSGQFILHCALSVFSSIVFIS